MPVVRHFLLFSAGVKSSGDRAPSRRTTHDPRICSFVVVDLKCGGSRLARSCPDAKRVQRTPPYLNTRRRNRPGPLVKSPGTTSARRSAQRPVHLPRRPKLKASLHLLLTPRRKLLLLNPLQRPLRPQTRFSRLQSLPSTLRNQRARRVCIRASISTTPTRQPMPMAA